MQKARSLDQKAMALALGKRPDRSQILPIGSTCAFAYHVRLHGNRRKPGVFHFLDERTYLLRYARSESCQPRALVRGRWLALLTPDFRTGHAGRALNKTCFHELT